MLGIEAARQTIINEMIHTMSGHGLKIDIRHMTLLGDVMSFKGQIHGIHRFGIGKLKDRYVRRRHRGQLQRVWRSALGHLTNTIVADVAPVYSCLRRSRRQRSTCLMVHGEEYGTQSKG